MMLNQNGGDCLLSSCIYYAEVYNLRIDNCGLIDLATFYLEEYHILCKQYKWLPELKSMEKI